MGTTSIFLLLVALTLSQVFSLPIQEANSSEESVSSKEDNESSDNGTWTWDTVISRLGTEPKSPSGHCRLLINEVNIDNPGPIDTHEFIGKSCECVAFQKNVVSFSLFLVTFRCFHMYADV
jgi:hypothetical protein